MVSQLTFILSVTSLYFGFAAVLGYLAATRKWAFHAMAAAYALTIYIPSTLLVLGIPAWPVVLRAALVLAAAAVGAVAALRPSWLAPLWKASLARFYLAGSMLATALWFLTQIAQPAAFASLLLGAAALAAGFASLRAALQPLSPPSIKVQ